MNIVRSAIESLNNIRVSRKLILIYLLCVILPTVIFVGVFLINTSVQVRDTQLNSLNKSLSNKKYSVVEMLEKCKLITDSIYANRIVGEILEKHYSQDRQEQVYEDRRIVDGILSNFLNSNRDISRITVYHKNEGMLNGGMLNFINQEVLDSEWYTKAKEHTGNIMVIDYNEKATTFISMIRYLDLYNNNSKSKILKVDISALNMSKQIYDSYIDSLGGAMLLVKNNNNVVAVMSHKPTQLKEAIARYKQSGAHDSRHYYIEAAFDSHNYLKGYKLVVIVPKSIFNFSIEKIGLNLLLLFLLLLFFTSVIIYFLSHSITYRLRLLVLMMKTFKIDDLQSIPGNHGKDEIGKSIEQYNALVDTIKSLLGEVYQMGIQKSSLELQKSKAELHALQSQINPHFLYNVLNTLRAKSVIKKEYETADILKSVSAIFRRQLDWNRDLITIEAEFEFIADFLAIQKYRFQERLSYIVELAPECRNILIPKMSIQPFVENASVHGVEKKKEPSSIIVKAYGEGDSTAIVIEDTGAGMNDDELSYFKSVVEGTPEQHQGSVGLVNTISRLKMYYKDELRILVESMPAKGTQIILSLPSTIKQ
ncbi:MAG: sensor histidine kinase [Clostridia bacterium]|nr:sensor histidine kinase [Clostridia bacterium]